MNTFALALLSSAACARQLLGADGHLNLAEYATGYITYDQYAQAAKNADSLYGAPVAYGADGHLNLYETGYLTEEARREMAKDQAVDYANSVYGAPTAMGADGHLNLYETGYLTEDARKEMRQAQYDELTPEEKQYYIQQAKLRQPTPTGTDGHLNLYETGYISYDQYADAARNVDNFYGAPTAMGADGHLNLYETGYISIDISYDHYADAARNADFYGAPTVNLAEETCATWVFGTFYKQGDIVCDDAGLYYHCKPYPEESFCQSYAPGSVNSHLAWDVCQDGENSWNFGTKYAEGELVCEGGQYYTCKAWPEQAWCQQYSPQSTFGDYAWNSQQ